MDMLRGNFRRRYDGDNYYLLTVSEDFKLYTYESNTETKRFKNMCEAIRYWESKIRENKNNLDEK